MREKFETLDKIGLFKFGVTTFFFIAFIQRTFESAFELDSLGMVISISVVSLLALVGLKNEFDSVQVHNKAWAKQFSTNEEIKIVLAFTFASFATYLLANSLNLSVSLAASIVVLTMVFLIPERFPIFQATVYTGTITGMVNNQFISNWILALLLGFVGSLFFLYFQPSYRATGGRAGLNAYMTSFLFIFLFPNVTTGIGAPLEKEIIIPSFLFLLIGSFSAYLLEEKTDLSGVQAAMLVTLILNILIPNKWPVLINAAFMGTFMGTSAPERVDSLRFLFLIELFAFILFVPAYPLLAGIGGKLGTITLIGYLAADGATSLINYFSK